jgi:hypothetical protein
LSLSSLDETAAEFDLPEKGMEFNPCNTGIEGCGEEEPNE